MHKGYFYLICLFIAWIPYWFQWNTKMYFMSQEEFWRLRGIKNEGNTKEYLLLKSNNLVTLCILFMCAYDLCNAVGFVPHLSIFIFLWLLWAKFFLCLSVKIAFCLETDYISIL